MKDSQSHISERVREDLDKLTPEKKAIMLEAADRAPSRCEHGRMSVGTPAKVVPEPIHRIGKSGD
jgi:hypothetical protein